MNVILVHPIHGAKVAISEREIEVDVKNGWLEYNPNVVDEMVSKPEKPARNKLSRKVTDHPVEQPNEVPEFLTSSSEESEGT